MESSGATLNIFGVTQDTSAIRFPINVSVNGGAFSVDVSGNVSVSANTTVQALLVNGNAALNENAYLAKNIAIMGGEYLGGNLYANGGITVGDTLLGQGVTMESSGSVLSVFAKDTSGNVLPATLEVENIITTLATIETLEATSIIANTISTPGGFAVDASANVTVSGNVSTLGTLSTNSGFNVDVSGNVIFIWF
jgi:cytoskeletal protein CcmA (bactofilin family)